MKRLMKIIILTLVLLIASPAQAELWKDHFKPTLKDGFDKKGLLIIGGGLLAVAIAQPNDYHVREQYSDHQKIPASNSKIGDLLGTGVPGSLLALSQIFFWDEGNGYAHAEAIFDAGMFTFAAKYAGGRNRPNSDNKYSMPSGHTSTTFASATSLAYAYGLKAALPAYMLAGFTAATRWSDDAHWFSDTVAGAVIGIFWGRASYRHHDESRCSDRGQPADPDCLEKTSSYFKILPAVSSQHVGAILAASF
jgi:membrane-associated phospholipid phosphatase